MAQSLVQAALDQPAPRLRTAGQAVKGAGLWLGEREPGLAYRYSHLVELLLRRFSEGLNPGYTDPTTLLMSRAAGSSVKVAISTADLQQLGTAINGWGDALLEVFKSELVAFSCFMPLSTRSSSEALFDRFWSSPRASLSTTARQALEMFKVRTVTTPAERLDSLGTWSLNGPKSGLVHLDGPLGDTLYQVAWSEDGP